MYYGPYEYDKDLDKAAKQRIKKSTKYYTTGQYDYDTRTKNVLNPVVYSKMSDIYEAYNEYRSSEQW